MRQSKSDSAIVFFFRLFVFWILMFLVQRILFIQLYSEPVATLHDHLESTVHALPMDISMYFYLMMIPFAIYLVSLFIQGSEIPSRITGIYMVVMILIANFIFTVDLGLYPFWEVKINHKLFFYLSNPKEAIVSTFSAPYAKLILIFILLSATFILLYRYLLQVQSYARSSLTTRMFFIPAFLGLSIIGMRGGLQDIPLGKHRVYYSEYTVFNQAALNSFWNCMDELVSAGQYETGAYAFYPDHEATRIFTQLMKPAHDTVVNLFPASTKPNLVVILLESWSAEGTGAYGNGNDLTPEFDSLTSKGLLFDHFYASGTRTDQGLISILSSFPAQPRNVIIRDFGKFERLPALSKDLKRAGYRCSYFCGSNSDFANTKAYLFNAGFNSVTDIRNFPLKKRTYWGAYDSDVFDYQINVASRGAAPFFHLVVTITNHEPFDAAVPKRFSGNDLVTQYRNTMAYTDRALGDYFRKARRMGWYKNTLFVITADHAHSMPYGRSLTDPRRYHIPLLLYGEPLDRAWRGKRVDQYGSQTDLSPTILAQLGLDHRSYLWGKNLINPLSPDFAYFAYDDGWGWLTPDQQITFDNNLGRVVAKTPPDGHDSLELNAVRNGKAYLQKYMMDYRKF